MGQRLHQVVEGRAAGQRLQHCVDVAPVGLVGQAARLQVHVLVAQLETRQGLCENEGARHINVILSGNLTI